MPYKDSIQRKKYHRNYYLSYKIEQIKHVKEVRKLIPWHYCLINIRQRCNNIKNPAYKHYGAKGIKCLITEDELKTLWFRDKGYELKRPSIDRIKSDKNYIFKNCRFIELSDNSIERNLRCSKKPIIQYGKQGQYVCEWASVGEASKFYDCHISNISNVLRGKSQTACGFKWRYKNVK